MKSVYSAVRTGSLNKAVCALSLDGYITDLLVSEPVHTMHGAVMEEDEKTITD
jgi:hypothetical protein